MNELLGFSTQIMAEQPQTPARGSGVMQIGLLVAILGIGVLLTALTSDVSKVSEPGVKLVNGQLFLVDKVADWTGGELQGLSDQEKKILPADTEGARRLFTDKEGHEVFCSIVLAGRDVTSIHRPELCLPGQGWTIQNEQVQQVPVATAHGGILDVMRINATRSIPLANGETGRYRAIFVYWFVGKNRTTPYHWQRIFWTSLDRVFYNTNHRWAYILISMPNIDAVGSVEETMKIISGFVQDIYPTLIARQPTH
ncbi:MAG TPA: EpsI family protein [Verrucomicrobiae bacterium]|nr:EpsI family protein [Verrucomicrobiae bacterium]